MANLKRRDEDDGEPSKYGDHPLLGKDRQPLAKELFRSPERERPDPMARPPQGENNVTPIRPEGWKDPSIEYQEPNPMLVVPRPNASLRLIWALVAVILAAGVMYLMFHNWMAPGARHPGETKQSPGLEQSIP